MDASVIAGDQINPSGRLEVIGGKGRSSLVSDSIPCVPFWDGRLER